MPKQSASKSSETAMPHGRRDASARVAARLAPRDAGNQVILHLLRSGAIQARIAVNAPDDPYEREADSVANQVMRMPGPAAAAPPRIHRACAHCTDDLGQHRIQRLCAQCEKDLRRKPRANLAGPEISSSTESRINALRFGGEPLPETARMFFQPRFGRDFADVRVHSTGAAAETARQVDALAYTMGSHIAFAPGRYAPDTDAGRRLLAHELVHTIQQTGPRITLMRLVGNGHDLKSARFAGDPVLEACFDDERYLQVGDRGKAVARVQQALIDAEFPLPVYGADGIFESETKVAVRNYQRAHGLGVDGIVGPITMGALDAQFVSPPGPASPPSGSAPASPKPAPTPVCPAVPTATPADCLGRNAGYCSAASCFPRNRWLKCACGASLQICQAVDAFSFKGVQGMQAEFCIDFTLPFPSSMGSKIETIYKGQWFLATNKCLWGHWRSALDALHASNLPVPTTLTSPWAAAVAECRSKGISSSECCKAQVNAEQEAIDTCGTYDSPRFGSMPTDLPGAPLCSKAAREVAPPPAFTGDFGKVADRIKYGNRRCCS